MGLINSSIYRQVFITHINQLKIKYKMDITQKKGYKF